MTTQTLRPMRVMRTFSSLLDGYFHTFEQGTVIRDLTVLETLSRTGCRKFLADETEAEKLATCPRCHNIVRVDSATVPVKVCNEAVALQINQQFLTFRRGDLLRDARVIESAINAGYDLQDGFALLCNVCSELF